MSNIHEKLQSIKTIANVDYVKPSIDKMNGFIDALKSSEEARTYLRVKRNFTDETIAHFRLGYDESRHAISIPVFKDGELINIRYRFIDPEKKPKYTQEKGSEVWVYNEDGINLGQKSGKLIIVEGEFDLMSVWQAGFKEVVSPASGKNSYGVWIEKVDPIPRIIIAYDNDKPGKSTAIQLAERIGIDKCEELLYPDDIKDANEYFMTYDRTGFMSLIKSVKRFTRYRFQGLIDIVESLRSKTYKKLILDSVPYIDWEDVWVSVLSGGSNVGKSTYMLNIANELAEKNIPTLVLPFERGVKSVGKRYLQVRCDATSDAMEYYSDDKWNDVLEGLVEAPLYFSKPNLDEFENTIRQAVRFFGVKFVLLDHLDYMVHGDNKFDEQAKQIRAIEELAQELDIKFVVVHHINKVEKGTGIKRKLSMEDLSGSSDIYKVPEVVILLQEKEDSIIDVTIAKSKGEAGHRYYSLNKATGKMAVCNDYDGEVSDDDVDDAFNKF